jgi:hypothetical protein
MKRKEKEKKVEKKDLLPSMQFKPRKRAIATDTPLINFSI